MPFSLFFPVVSGVAEVSESAAVGVGTGISTDGAASISDSAPESLAGVMAGSDAWVTAAVGIEGELCGNLAPPGMEELRSTGMTAATVRGLSSLVASGGAATRRRWVRRLSLRSAPLALIARWAPPMKNAPMSAALSARRADFRERAFFFFLLGASATGGAFIAGGAGGNGLNWRGSAGAGLAASGLIGSRCIGAGLLAEPSSSMSGRPATGEGGSCGTGWWYGDVGLDGVILGA